MYRRVARQFLVERSAQDLDECLLARSVTGMRQGRVRYT